MKTYKAPNKGIFLLLLFVLIFAITLNILRNASYDEVHYLNDSLYISHCFKSFKWIGNEQVGFHGVLFKIPAALLLIFTGPSVFIATLVNIIPAILAVYISYLIFIPFLKSRNWALSSSFLVFSSVFFLRTLATYKRDGVILFCLLFFLYLNIKNKNKWLIGLSLLLVLDAKESVFFMILPGYIIWVIYEEFLKNKSGPRGAFLIPGTSRLFAAFFPSFIFLFLMLTTGIIPLNPVAARILGINQGGLKSAIAPLRPAIATRNTLEGGKTIFQLPTFNNYGWKTNYTGEVVMLPATLTDKKFPIVKLIKPNSKSPHKSGGYYHYCQLTKNPVLYTKGDIIVYSLWYKTSSADSAGLIAVNNFPGEIGHAGAKKIKLQKDRHWHLVKIEVPVTHTRKLFPELRWPYGRDMVLYVAGCKIEKKVKTNIPTQTKNNQLKTLRKKDKAKPVTKPSPGAQEVSNRLPQFKNKVSGFINLLLLYIGKIFFSRTFSFTSMPRFIILPALFMSFLLFKQWKKNREYEKLLLPLILWFYLVVYLLRSSFGRYMLPMVPIILLFFFFFLQEGLKKKKFARNTLIAVIVFATIGLYFETNYPFIKLALTVFFTAGLFLLYLKQGSTQTQKIYKLQYIYVLMIGIFSIAVFLATSYTEPRQIGRYIAWGYNNEMNKIARHFDKDDIIWINQNQGLVQFYRNDNKYLALHTHSRLWELQEWVPKAAMVSKNTDLKTYSFKWENQTRLKEKAAEKKIKKIALVVSTIKKDKFTFPMQEQLPDMQKMSFLTLLKKVEMKNKVLYIFKVTGT